MIPLVSDESRWCLPTRKTRHRARRPDGPRFLDRIYRSRLTHCKYSAHCYTYTTTLYSYYTYNTYYIYNTYMFNEHCSSTVLYCTHCTTHYSGKPSALIIMLPPPQQSPRSSLWRGSKTDCSVNECDLGQNVHFMANEGEHLRR